MCVTQQSTGDSAAPYNAVAAAKFEENFMQIAAMEASGGILR
jgi:hypothetical protein